MDQNFWQKLNPSEKESPIKITDLIDDCLEHILGFLKLGDLLNVACSSKFFKESSDLVFKRQYKLTKFSIDNQEDRFPMYGEQRSQNINLNLSHCFKFLRCFGHLISGLQVNYASIAPAYRSAVSDYVNEYCSDSLTELGVFNANDLIPNLFRKPFPKVECVYFLQCALNRDSTDFNKWFPQMSGLLLMANKFADNRCIEKHFPHLNRLVMQSSFFGIHQSLKESNIYKCIQLNPQLHHLGLSHDKLGMKFFERIGRHLQQLELLAIKCRADRLNYDRGIIHMKNVTHFTIDEFYPRSMSELPFLFNEIKTFVCPSSKLVLSMEFLDFIRKHRTLTKLSLNMHRITRFTDFRYAKDEIARALPELAEVEIGHTFSIDEAVDFINAAKTLKTFAFDMVNRNDYDELKRIIGKEWRTSIDVHHIVDIGTRTFKYNHVKLQR